jgi:LAO/AO transport system kinase
MQIEAQLWVPPIIRTVATEGQGIAELAAAIGKHRQHLVASGELAQRELTRLRAELDLLLREALVARWQDRMPDERFAQTLERVARREISPWQAADELAQGV